MIRLEQVWKSFAGRAALRGVSLSVAKGDAVLLTGPSGAGKSTLLRLAFAAEQADRGELFVNGRSLGKLQPSSIPFVRRNIGVVFQDFKLLSTHTALENVAIALEILGLPRREIGERAQKALASVGLESRAQVRAGALSGGEQQRVAIARALVGEPAILLADEPTGNLDPDHTQSLLKLIGDIHARGTTILLATHDPIVVEFGLEHGWRLARLVDGEMLDEGDLLLTRPARHDEETGGFSGRPDKDATAMIRLPARSTPATVEVEVHRARREA